MKLFSCAVFSFLMVMVASHPTAGPETVSFDELDQIEDPMFVFPPNPDLIPADSDTYFEFYEYHDQQLIKNTVLQCSENKPKGTHPHPVEGCEEILDAQGDCTTNINEPQTICVCPALFDPVIVNIQGKYKSADFRFLHRFANPCVFQCETQSMEHFFNVGLGFKM